VLKPDEMIKRLKPLIGDRADAIWNSYLASDEEERGLIQHSLENLHSQMVDDYKREKLILTPPFKFEHLHGDYPAGMVYYADKPLYPFAFLEKELMQHIGVFGRTGAGKSFFVKGLLLTHFYLKKPLLLFDWKGTYRDMLAEDVFVFEPGSDSFPFFFNPLDLEGIPAEQRKTYIRQIIELFIDCFLEDLKLLTVQGVESLLLRAVDYLLENNQALSFQSIYEFLRKFEGRMREMDWKTSALNILYKLVTGPLGKVMNNSCNIEWLSNQKIIFELSNVGNSKDKSFFIRSLLLRLYYHFMGKGSSASMRLLIVIEEAHNILLKKGTGFETIVELMLRQIREFGVGICVVDQHPSLMALPALGTYCTVSFNLKLRQDRDAMASALNLEQAEYLGRLPPRFAIVKIQDRFLTPFLIEAFDITQRKAPHPYELTPNMDVEEEPKKDAKQKAYRKTPKPKSSPKQADDVMQRIVKRLEEQQAIPSLTPADIKLDNEKESTGLPEYAEVRRALPPTAFQPAEARTEPIPIQESGYKEKDGYLDGFAEVSRTIHEESRALQLIRDITKRQGKPLLWEEVFLIHMYLSLGFEWLKSRGFCPDDPDKMGGIQHSYWKRRLCEQFRKKGLQAELEVSIGDKQSVDLVVSHKRKVAVEIESTNPYEKIIGNITKCKGHGFSGVVSFLLDAGKAGRVKELVKDERVAVVCEESRCIDAVMEFLQGDAKKPEVLENQWNATEHLNGVPRFACANQQTILNRFSAPPRKSSEVMPIEDRQ